MRILLSGGGTGGHIYPAITIADKLVELDPNSEILFVGTKHGLESSIVPHANYKIEFIDVIGLKRSISLETIKTFGKAISSCLQAKKIINKFKPDLVIGTGGYVCGPILLMAALSNIPTCIQEQNAVAGMTNKILGRFVDAVFLGYEEARKYFPGNDNTYFTGNPIRDTVIKIRKADAIAAFAIDVNKRALLISGGSRGAKTINNAMLEAYKPLLDTNRIQIIHVTGEATFKEHMSKVSPELLANNDLKIYPYLHDMPLALAGASMAIFRAGAIGVAELMARHVPSILVPYPYATGDHQDFNARAIEKKGACIVVKNDALTSEFIVTNVLNLLLDDEKLGSMQEATTLLAKPHASLDIAKKALLLISNRETGG